jgi:hypothetical protein
MASAVPAIQTWIFLMDLVIIIPEVVRPLNRNWGGYGEDDQIGATLAALQHLFLAQMNCPGSVDEIQPEHVGQIAG